MESSCITLARVIRAFSEVARLLKKNYPNEVADLGSNASVKLDALLESLW